MNEKKHNLSIITNVQFIKYKKNTHFSSSFIYWTLESNISLKKTNIYDELQMLLNDQRKNKSEIPLKTG